MKLITKEQLVHDLKVYAKRVEDIAIEIDCMGNIAGNRKEYTISLELVNKLIYFTIQKLK